jgi:uncharacterized protein YebE (UPF0316 family)
MKISPVVRKQLILFNIGLFIPISITFSFLIYHLGTPTIINGYLTLSQTVILVNLILILILTIEFIFTYYHLISDFKQFEAKFSNLETIIKAIEHSRIEDVTNTNENYQHITYDSGIDIGSDRNGTYWLEEIEIPKFSYLYYLVSKKGKEHNLRINQHIAEKRTEMIINKMKQSWED